MSQKVEDQTGCYIKVEDQVGCHIKVGVMEECLIRVSDRIGRLFKLYVSSDRRKRRSKEEQEGSETRDGIICTVYSVCTCFVCTVYSVGTPSTPEQEKKYSQQRNRIKSLFKRQLRIPHLEMENTLAEYQVGDRRLFFPLCKGRF